MLPQRRVILILFYLSLVVAGSGFIIFIAGIVVEFTNMRTEPVVGGLSAPVTIAMSGLCAMALVFLLWFVLAGYMLARQTRAMGSGYGDAYRMIEQFRFKDAIPLLERSISEGKENPEVLMLLTSAYAYSGQFARAQATADRTVELYPNEADAYITLANGYRMQALYDEAVRSLQRAAELSPNQPVIWAEMGFTQLLAGQANESYRSLERAASQAMPAPYVVRVNYHLAEAYTRQGDTKQAVRATAKMVSARDGVTTWKAALRALEGTAYGQSLRYEVAGIEQALADADAGTLG
ncbi:MAG TPA: tetratricopeptide repeat protein [Candidatus Limnocylindrales bacterium]|nr:tetratricopeptide repeat protein [Candidatus Limnocylindrales bacterium]